MSEFKFINASKWWSHNELDVDFRKVSNPTKYDNLPNGEYHIRGDKKNFAKYYWVLDNIWYLTENKQKDNGHYMCEAGTYQLFPPLSEKEWKELGKIPYKRLMPIWRRYLYGYQHYMEIRDLRRNFTKNFIRYYKKKLKPNQ